jgi:hypothetical protein
MAWSEQLGSQARQESHLQNAGRDKDIQMKTVKVINANGLAQINGFLSTHHIAGGDIPDHILESWAYDAEYELSKGRPPCIQLRSWEAIDGCAREFRISDSGIEIREVESEKEE